MNDLINEFVKGLHSSSKVVGYGTVTVLGNTVDAVVVRNLYGQLIAWGGFSVERGKFKGKLANNANTEGADFRWAMDPRDSPTLRRLNRQWLDNLQYPNMSHELH
jgi:hypothetical protein